LLSARRGESLGHVYSGRGSAEADVRCEHSSYGNIPSGNIPSGALGVSTSHHQPQYGEVRRRSLQPTECPRATSITLAALGQSFGGFEAMAAMSMFDWSTAMLATVIVKVQGIDT
jgi:hypothetical protein